MTIFEDLRIGRFTIDLDLINSDPVAVREVLKGIIVIRAEVRLDANVIEYFGICDAFKELDIAALGPTYTARLRKLDDGGVELVGWELSGWDRR
jgi:hypothetical protein